MCDTIVELEEAFRNLLRRQSASQASGNVILTDFSKVIMVPTRTPSRNNTKFFSIQQQFPHFVLSVPEMELATAEDHYARFLILWTADIQLIPTTA